MTQENLIEVRGVRKTFGAFLAVDNLSMDVRRGEIVVLLGQTGAGKSTVLNLIMGTTRPDSGQIRVAGFDPYASFKALKGRLSVSFQTDRLLPWRTADRERRTGTSHSRKIQVTGTGACQGMAGASTARRRR